MQYAINVPCFGDYGDARMLAELAREAEGAGWDGFFVWDHLHFFDPPQPVPVTDPWVALTAIATVTNRLRLGPMVTPLARRRPWKVAREAVALDRLSGGRLILGVGLGEPAGADFAAFGEDPDPRVRAAKLDEGLAILAGLWTGEPFSFEGQHYQVRDALFLPLPTQQPRIPIWVAGTWPNKAPMRRAARWDGVFPLLAGDFATPMPDDVRAISAYISSRREGGQPLDITLTGTTSGEDRTAAVAQVAPYLEAGLTWWQEELSGRRGPLEAMRERIRQGPPRP